MAEASVAVIGAGLSGLALALALHRQNIPSVVYESRDAPLDIGGALMLSPNALKILDALGIYADLLPLGFRFEHLHFRLHDDRPVDVFEFGSVERYGYPGLRAYRYELISLLVAAVRDAGIPVRYGKKFARVVDESRDGVAWEFADGSTGRAQLLVGADGIHSRVRRYIYPDLEPRFTNMMGVNAVVPRSQLGDREYPLPVTIMNPTVGAFVMAAQRPGGEEVFIGKQRRLEGDLDREGWAALTEDKSWCIDFLRKDSEAYPPVVGRALSDISVDKINLWPFYIVPKLTSWVSESHGRVVILGDAAHALPPSAGQGVNQAFEDVYTFAVVLGRTRGEGAGPTRLREALRRWQAGRQARVDRILDLNGQIDKRRLPGAQVDQEPFELGWLYSPDFDKMAESWAAGEGEVTSQ
ncbi:FAD-dependent urate hydroxylase [Paramyrothecium foliicola]|nr:FAD-dependent urate hydroxylase [Paramyrothecium foliicola]